MTKARRRRRLRKVRRRITRPKMINRLRQKRIIVLKVKLEPLLKPKRRRKIVNGRNSFEAVERSVKD